MSTRILEGEAGAALYDSVTERAFGPLFESEEDAVNFLQVAGENKVTVFPWTAATEEFHTAWVRGQVPESEAS